MILSKTTQIQSTIQKLRSLSEIARINLYEYFATDIHAAITEINRIASSPAIDPAAVAAIQILVESIQEDVTNLEGAVVALQAAVVILQGQVTTLQGQVTTLQADVTALQADVNTLEAIVAAMQVSITALETPVTCRLVFGSTVTLATGVDTPLSWGDGYDPLGMHSPGSELIVFPQSGTYLVIPTILFDPNPTGFRMITVYTTPGVGQDIFVSSANAVAGFYAILGAPYVLVGMNAGAAVRLRALQDSGGNLNLHSASCVSVTKLK